jgi:glutamate-1-semialdehyde aminotransferase
MRAEASVDPARIASLLAREQDEFHRQHPKSVAMSRQARQSLLAGVPMNWMLRWASRIPPFVEQADGARVTDIDGHTYIDFCLGDTGAMAGHAPSPTVQAVNQQARRGVTFMLPTADALWVGQEMTRRFGVGQWQLTLTATDANRFAIRLARAVTGRPKILVFNYCYHGSVDETFAVLDDEGQVVARPGNLGRPVDLATTTRVVEFNDVEALERELASGDVACVLAEPALTNIGIILPEAGYHDRLRQLTRASGTLLIIDETHTICAGPGGYTKAAGLEPDIVTIGKTIAGGIPAAAFGISRELAQRVLPEIDNDDTDVSGIGGTLAANALSMAAARATLEQVLTDSAFARMIRLAERWTDGVREVIGAHQVPWTVTRLGCRAEYVFTPQPPRTGGEAAAAMDHTLERFMHLFALNRGILLTPFHNMALMCPMTAEADVDRHTSVFEEAVAALFD